MATSRVSENRIEIAFGIRAHTQGHRLINGLDYRRLPAACNMHTVELKRNARTKRVSRTARPAWLTLSTNSSPFFDDKPASRPLVQHRPQCSILQPPALPSLVKLSTAYSGSSISLNVCIAATSSRSSRSS